MKRRRGEGKRFQEGERFVEVESDEADKGDATGDERTAPDDVVVGRLHGDCSESGEGFFYRELQPWVSEAQKNHTGAVGDGVEKVLLK